MAKPHSTDKIAKVSELSRKKDDFEESLFGGDEPRVLTRAQSQQLRQRLAEERLIKDLQERSPREADSISFMPAALVRLTLPYRQPKDSAGNFLDQYTRETSQLRLTIKTMRPEYGLPYGSFSRLLMAWVSQEAVRSKSPIIPLVSLRALCKLFGLSVNGVTAQRLKDHVLRIRYSLFYIEWRSLSKPSENVTLTKDLLFPAVVAAELWQERDVYGNLTLKENSESYIRLSQEFFNEICMRPTPIDWRIYKELNPSALAMDIYTYLTYRSSFTHYDTLLTWTELKNLFGANYDTMAAFRKAFRIAMKKIVKFYTGLRCEDDERGLLLKPDTRPSVPKQDLRPPTKRLPSRKTEPANEASVAASKKKSASD